MMRLDMQQRDQNTTHLTADAPLGRYRSLDAIRGIAAFIVMLTHCYGILPYAMKLERLWLKTPPFLFFTNGRGAVVVFFVLSGFVLALPWFYGRAPSFKHFLIRRLCRIYIPFAATLLLSAILFSVVDHPLTATTAGIRDWADVFWGGKTLTPSVIGHHLLMGGLWGDIFLDSPMWSLVHELRISLVFPLLVLLCTHPKRGIIATIFISILATLALQWHGPGPDFPARADDTFSTFIVTAYFIPCFLLGILLAGHHVAISAWLAKISLEWRCMLWVAALAVFSLVNDYNAIVQQALAAGLLIMLTLSSTHAATALTVPVLQWLGRISYSLYLVHVPILCALVLSLRGHLSYGWIDLIAIATALSVAELMCRFVELPAMTLGKHLTR
jgi:peptidoglycan/LPS O-acetylase OafA/YrhL